MNFAKNNIPKLFFLILIFLIAVSCAQNASNISQNENSQNKGENLKYVTIETDKGIIKAEIYTDKAPITAKNFIGLASSGFYNGLKFHRVEPGFVIQGGDPKGDGTGGSEKNIPLEINPQLTHVKGALAMARAQDPNSARSQFYITLADVHFLDGNYAVFGKVISGMEFAEKIKVGDKMNKVYITDS